MRSNVCPACSYLFVRRNKQRCPKCRVILLVYNREMIMPTEGEVAYLHIGPSWTTCRDKWRKVRGAADG